MNPRSTSRRASHFGVVMEMVKKKAAATMSRTSPASTSASAADAIPRPPRRTGRPPRLQPAEGHHLAGPLARRPLRLPGLR